MCTQPPGAPAPSVTAKFPFSRCNNAGDLLFEVRAGIPAIDALESASCFMASARDLAAECASNMTGDHPDHMWGAYYLIEMSKAALDSAISALSAEERNHV